jgi:2,4-dienoyl-CoA reductase-like NADH-dependent reductase (Old Yellow Enzyme family)
MDDTLILAKQLSDRGIDVIDCSSRGLMDRGTLAPGREPGYQVPYAESVRRNTGSKGMAVGLITKPEHANEIIDSGQADLVAIGRESLYNPNWPVQAAVALKHDPDYSTWPKPYGWWLLKRDQSNARRNNTKK